MPPRKRLEGSNPSLSASTCEERQVRSPVPASLVGRFSAKMRLSQLSSSPERMTFA